ncbi:hypothetical protein BDA96_06G041800 [Sorghum bicolor]|uniref:Uncharacterized protein n=1 Tax=Sorghum bicolor TaxID=4558 RepID=A0A921QNG3_SORBI|nr:hypothetical protein BDA96_06G041800 [Sorghum bicolor]
MVHRIRSFTGNLALHAASAGWMALSAAYPTRMRTWRHSSPASNRSLERSRPSLSS